MVFVLDTICENSSKTLVCGDNRKLVIQSATYGRSNIFTCPIQDRWGDLWYRRNRDNWYYNFHGCNTLVVTQQIKAYCKGPDERRCNIRIRNALSIRKCSSIERYLTVTYICSGMLFTSFTCTLNLVWFATRIISFFQVYYTKIQKSSIQIIVLQRKPFSIDNSRSLLNWDLFLHLLTDK